MSFEDHEFVDAQLPNGAPIKIAVTGPGGARDVGFRDAFSFEHVQEMVTGLAEMVQTAASKATPDGLELEFGLTFTVEEGKLLGLLVHGSTEAALTVRLNWGQS